MADEGNLTYDDGLIACDGTELVIRRYYPWGAKRIPYASVTDVRTLPLAGASLLRRWRIWGSGDFVHWWNLDPGRPRKRLALVVVEVGQHIRPTITPDDPEAVERILRAHLASAADD